jgi:hypothetical protein
MVDNVLKAAYNRRKGHVIYESRVSIERMLEMRCPGKCGA